MNHKRLLPFVAGVVLSSFPSIIVQGCGGEDPTPAPTPAPTDAPPDAPELPPIVELLEGEGGEAVIDAQAKMTLVGQSFSFTEGPLWVPDHNMWIFSDVVASIMYKFKDGVLTKFREPSHKANGNTLDGQGRLLTCEHESRVVSRTSLTDDGRDGERQPLIDEYDDRELNSPNDIIVTSDGTIYFTDPDYGRSPDYGHGNSTTDAHVFRWKDEALTSVYDGLERPNGLALTADEKKMYIADSGASGPDGFNQDLPHEVFVFDVGIDGSLSNKKLFWTVAEGNGVPDGLKVDNTSNVWSVSTAGVEILKPAGTLMARINTTNFVTNIAFGNNSLMITSGTSVWIVEVKVKDAKDAKDAKSAAKATSEVVV